MSLLKLRCPSTIPWFIVPIWIRIAIQGFICRTCSHVFEKGLKVFFPAVTHSYAATAVVIESRSFGVETPILRSKPRSICRTFSSGRTMTVSDRCGVSSASAARSTAGPEKRPVDNGPIATLALTEPFSLFLQSVLGTRKHSQKAKYTASKIDEVPCGQRPPATAALTCASEKGCSGHNCFTSAVALAYPHSRMPLRYIRSGAQYSPAPKMSSDKVKTVSTAIRAPVNQMTSSDSLFRATSASTQPYSLSGKVGSMQYRPMAELLSGEVHRSSNTLTMAGRRLYYNAICRIMVF